MTDIQAVVGREQLKRLPEMISQRRRLEIGYRELLRTVPGIMPAHEPEWARSNWQSYCARLPDGCDQRRVKQALLDSGVATRRGNMCAHREPAYGNLPWLCGNDRVTCGRATGTCTKLQESEEAQAASVLLPLFHQMTEAGQIKVVNALHQACTHESQH